MHVISYLRINRALYAVPQCKVEVTVLLCKVWSIPIVYVNRDQLTGFGTPWEIRFESNYTILRKGGNVGGYSALFSYIPNLQLGEGSII